MDIEQLQLSVYVNEEGLLRDLPFNERITSLWWAFVPEVRFRAWLVGDVVIFGHPDLDGNTLDIPDPMLRRICNWLA